MARAATSTDSRYGSSPGARGQHLPDHVVPGPQVIVAQAAEPASHARPVLSRLTKRRA